jgi:hypothetical protein
LDFISEGLQDIIIGDGMLNMQFRDCQLIGVSK